MEKTNKYEQATKEGICYIPFLGWIPALGFLFGEKDSRIRFQAAQSVIIHAMVGGVFFVAVPVMYMTRILSIVAAYTQGIVGVAFVLLCLWLIVETKKGRQPKLGWIAEWAEKMAGK